MKKIVLLLFVSFAMMFAYVPANGQILKRLEEKAKQKAAQRADQKVDQAMDKGLDEVEGKNKTKTEKDGDTKTKTEDGTKIKTDEDGTKVKTENGKGASNQLTFTSKYDFVPGEKVIAFEDLSNTEVGDFPTRWNTNASAEIVTINNKEGKWMKIGKVGVFLPEFIDNLPENFTLEFHVGVNDGFYAEPFVVNIGNLKDKKDYTDFYHHVNWRHGHAVHLEFRPAMNVPAWSRILTATDGNYLISNTVEFRTWDNEKTKFAHVALWRQNARLRVYVNGEKIWDIPRAFDGTNRYNTLTFAYGGSNKPDDAYFLSNIRMAIGAPDTRNKLITEGKFVTRGILFDVNSDKIKSESAGALKEIGTILKENPNVKVEIIGHTDADGDDKSNLDLSKRRAAAVKAYLVKEFSISADNLSTDGKGESVPVDKNTTVEGKANNRRVEFIKQ